MPDEIASAVQKLAQIRDRLLQSLPPEHLKCIKQNPAGAHRPEYDDSGWETPANGIRYTRDDGTLWIRFSLTIPEKVMGIPVQGSRVRLMTIFQAPFSFYIDGELKMQERTWVDFRAPEILLTESAQPGRTHHIAVKIETPGALFYWSHFFFETYIETVDDIRFDVSQMMSELQYAGTLPGGMELLTDAAAWLEPHLSAILAGEKSALELPELLAETRGRCEALRLEAKKRRVYLVGHAHIDMNWLWEMEETKDIIRRDFTTVCKLSDEFDSFRFSQSQCAVYDIARTHFPELYERVREKIRQGKWDVTASAWVEHDANMSSGETMARHILYSQRYLAEEFGITPRILWAPDTFGHSGNIPQLLRKSGIDRYFMMRCGKEDSKDPSDRCGYGGIVSDHPLFYWEGLDKSRVLAANLEYNGEFITDHIVRNMLQAEGLGLTTALYVYGVGDHGGAPTRRDIMRALKASDSPLLPQILFGTTDDYYTAVEAEAKQSDKLSIRQGEMNFVFEGCYTTHGDLKRAIRLLENKLLQAEMLCLLAGDLGFRYPADELRECWKTLLFNQFHDIYDGCAIPETYAYAVRELAAAADRAARICEEAAGTMIRRDEGSITVINPTPYPFKREVGISADSPQDPAAYFTAEVPPMGARTYSLKKLPVDTRPLILAETQHTFTADTPFYYAVVQKRSGQITTFFDKAQQRFLVREGKESWRSARGTLNTFALSREAPVPMSAWTLGETVECKILRDHATVTMVENTGLCAALSVRHQAGASEISQVIRFSAVEPIIRFETQVDWKEPSGPRLGTPVLRVCFSPRIENREVLHEIPFAVLARSCKEGEYPHLRFCAVEDEQGGFALLNDCKHGVQTCGNRLDLTLIRGAWDPDPHADQCSHTFTYALYAYGGRAADSEVFRYAHQLQQGPLVVSGSAVPLAAWFPELPANLCVDALKAPEEGSGILLRMHEAFGKETVLRMEPPVPGMTACETTIGEEESLKDYPTGPAEFVFAPYEIKTILWSIK